MSLSKNISDAIEKNIKVYISQVASQYNLNEDDLYKMWNNNGEYKTREVPKVVQKEEPVADPELMKLGKKELIEICKTKGLTVSGTKTDLINRIMGCVSKPKAEPKKAETSSQPNIIKKLSDKIPTIEIKRNFHGNFEHSDTRFVFNNLTKKAYGKQNDDGTISELTSEDINICHKYKFAYDIPENLNSKNTNDDDEDDDVEVEDELVEEEEDELDDDDDEEVEEEEELEEYYEDE